MRISILILALAAALLAKISGNIPWLSYRRSEGRCEVDGDPWSQLWGPLHLAQLRRYDFG